MTGQVLLERQGAIALVTLSHPGKLNAMSRAMWRELRAAFLVLHEAADCRCVVLQGEGNQFCAGGDIAEYPEFRFDAAALRAFHEVEVWGGLGAILDCDVPVVAAIEGACMGAGLEIASCCDLRIASDASRFGAPIAKLGFPMAPREAEVVAAAVGLATVREMLLEAALLDAATLHARGFVQRLATEGEAGAQALAAAHRITALSPQAARLNKQALRRLARHDPVAAWPRADLEAAYAYADSTEHRAGIAAFLSKRKPVF